MTERRGIVRSARAATLSMLVSGAVLTACTERPAEPDGIDRETFVAVYVDLRQAVVAGAGDSAVRDSILAGHGLTEAELRAYVDERAGDPAGLAETWREIMDSIAARDTAGARSDTLRSNP